MASSPTATENSNSPSKSRKCAFKSGKTLSVILLSFLRKHGDKNVTFSRNKTFYDKIEIIFAPTLVRVLSVAIPLVPIVRFLYDVHVDIVVVQCTLYTTTISRCICCSESKSINLFRFLSDHTHSPINIYFYKEKHQKKNRL